MTSLTKIIDFFSRFNKGVYLLTFTHSERLETMVKLYRNPISKGYEGFCQECFDKDIPCDCITTKDLVAIEEIDLTLETLHRSVDTKFTTIEEDELAQKQDSPVWLSPLPRRHRNICFTFNNYPKHWQDSVNLDNIKYLICQEEIGESGTRHIQGYVEFKEGYTLRSIKDTLGSSRIHIEPRRGTAKQASDYCQKKTFDGAQIWVVGEISQQGKRSDLTSIGDMITQGASSSEISEKYWSSYARNYRVIDKMTSNRKRLFAALHTVDRPIVKIFWGPPGTGKSHQALMECVNEGLTPYPVVKGTGNTWYDGIDVSFEGRSFDAMIFNDFNGWDSYDNILRLTDIYSTQLQVKGNQIVLPPMKRIYFTSNKYPTEWWPNTDQKEFLGTT